MKKFIENVIDNPSFADVQNEHVIAKVGIESFAAFNKETLTRIMLECIEKGAETSLLYIFSYFPSLAKVLFPEINNFQSVRAYHEVFDVVDQNMIDMYVDFDVDGEGSRFVKNHLSDMEFIKNLMQICKQVFPSGWKLPINGNEGKKGPGMYSQLEETPSIAKIIAVLLLATGKSDIDDVQIHAMCARWNKEFALLGQNLGLKMDCDCTLEKIQQELQDFSEKGIEVDS